MNIKTTTFETSKTLAKYLQIETAGVIDYNDKYWTHEDLARYNRPLHTFENYPAPTLEELLEVSPIYMEIANSVLKPIYRIYYWLEAHTRLDQVISKSDNLTEAVAKIIIEYYEGING
jgi:hypothetical protein